MNIQRKIALIILICSVLFFNIPEISAQNKTRLYKEFKPFKMAFAPDIHLSSDQKDNWILYKESLVLFQDAIKTLNKTKNLEFIVFGGDLIDNKDHEISDIPIFLDIMSELKSSYYVIIGDRDVNTSNYCTKRDFLDEFDCNSFEDKDKTYWSTEPTPNVMLIGLDTTASKGYSGFISNDQLEWLDNLLSNNKDKFTIITMHHPSMPLENQQEKFVWKDFSISNSADFLQLIKKHPQVKIVLSGHHHINSNKKVNDTVFISSASLATYPNKFTMLSVYPNKLQIETKATSYKQIVKKAKKTMLKSKYAKNYIGIDGAQLLKLHKGTSNKTYFFNRK